MAKKSAKERVSTRRAFLTGKSAVDAIAEAAQGAVQDKAALAPAPPEQSYLTRVSRRAMACEFQIILNAGQESEALQAALDALDLVEELEAQLTVYRDSSELMHINRVAAERPVVVEQGLFELLERSLELHRQTRGAFDITSGPLSKAWGFYRRAGAIPTDDALEKALACVGSQHVTLDADKLTVSFDVAGIELNLGSIGKGYAVDRAAERLQAHGLSNFMIHGGQSSVLARGGEADAGRSLEGWRVGVRDPLRQDVRLFELTLVDQALATSGSGTQFFRYGGKRYGHILDPRSGMPAEGVFSTTVIAPTAAEADALATAFYVMGVDDALEYCQKRSDVAALILYPGAGANTVELATANLDQIQWKQLRPI